jgi:cytochrome c oxidase subunit 1
MFVSGIGPVSVAAFSLSSMFIAVPTGVKIFNWLATMWAGKLRLTVPMCFCVGMVAMFTIGGLSGVTHAVSPADAQQTDTYYIVAHFHYVLFGGSLFSLVGGMYYWWPKVFGYHLRESSGKLHFWLMLLGFNLTFAPMHILGLQGQPRRTATYPEGMGWDLWNLVSTIGSFLIGVSFLVFAYNILISRKDGRAQADPWDGRTLEWSTSSPPPPHNFDVAPTVSKLDEWWHRKYEDDERGQLVRRERYAYLSRVDEASLAAGGQQPEGGRSSPHLPSPSYWPIILAGCLPLVAYGLLYTYWLSAIGGLVFLMAVYGWALEPSVERVPSPEGDGHAVG